MSEKRVPPPPIPDEADDAYDSLKTALSIIPPASDIFEYFFARPIERRLQAWREDVTQVVNELVKHGLATPESLRDNESFTTAALHASLIAVRTTKREKHEALRNALLNSALPGAPDEDLQMMFMQLVESLTAWHISVINAIFEANRETSILRETVSKDSFFSGLQDNTHAAIVLRIVQLLLQDKRLPEILANDLIARGLVSVKKKKGWLDAEYYEIDVTYFAKQFLDYIKSPFDDSGDSEISN